MKRISPTIRLILWVGSIVLCVAIDAAQERAGRPMSMAGRKALQRAGKSDPEQDRLVAQLQTKIQEALHVKNEVEEKKELFPFEWAHIDKRMRSLNDLLNLVTH